MRNARLRSIPPVPATLEELHDVLQNYHPMKHMYKGLALADDGSQCLLFIDDRMIDPLSRCNQLFSDGTFDVRLCKTKLKVIPRNISVAMIRLQYAHKKFRTLN